MPKRIAPYGHRESGQGADRLCIPRHQSKSFLLLFFKKEALALPHRGDAVCSRISLITFAAPVPSISALGDSTTR